jgi:hypothetical protein
MNVISLQFEKKPTSEHYMGRYDAIYVFRTCQTSSKVHCTHFIVFLLTLSEYSTNIF